ncbi:DNA adenine methylase [Nanoarchaeota archaeon]
MKKEVPTLVKWVGGKKQLLEQFKPLFPKELNRYFEPFVGGGAIAFYILKNFKPKEVILSDINEELINCLNIVKNNVEGLIKELKILKKNHNKEYYYLIRAKNLSKLSKLQRASRFIYLNKTCFNGLYRVNSKGGFNVPIGSYKNPKICGEEDLREISELLRNAKIEVKQFYEISKEAKKGDFVYFDPPYHPLNKTSFTTYTKDKFLEKEQELLAETFKRLNENGVKVMLSNSDTEFIKDLYRDFKINFVDATRMINSDASKRGKIKEVVITNYSK